MEMFLDWRCLEVDLWGRKSIDIYESLYIIILVRNLFLIKRFYIFQHSKKLTIINT